MTSAVARKLGFYVYLYVDPQDDSVFYVGKGKNGRVLSHLRAVEKRAITKRIRQIHAAGKQPRLEILAHGLPNADAAFTIEAAAIDLVGLDNLANAVRGHGAKYGRMPLQEALAHYSRRKIDIREPAILIRINKAYRYGMTEAELYDATRSAWRVGAKRDQAQYAFSVFEGVVREVYRISQWLPAGSTLNTRGTRRRPHRWEFVGTIADDKIHRRYMNRYVGHLFTPGAQNPISYVNVE